MKSKNRLTQEDVLLFREAIGHTRPLLQDTVHHAPRKTLPKRLSPKKVQQEQIDASFYFSDEFQPQLSTEGPTRYVRADVSHYELKKLRRGDYSPELFLDLHGMTQRQAKQELGALVAACRREQVHCACVMHGHGKHILKQQTPLWLAQHPDITAFHQAPRDWGGTAALLILVDLPAKATDTD